MNTKPRKTKIKIRDLNLYYGDFKALNNINMNIYEGEITALIGPSGCGRLQEASLWTARKF